MDNLQYLQRTQVNIQPVLHLVDLFEESTEYERTFRLPFNALILCVEEDPEDPSWVDLSEKRIRYLYQKGKVYFGTCETPMKIRFTRKNLHYVIHFRYELFPGVDLFSGVKERYLIQDETFAEKIRDVFSETDPLRRITRAESVVLETVLAYWPSQLPLDFKEMLQFEKLLNHIKNHLDSRMGIAEMAAVMGWSEAYFSRKFHAVFHITPKQYLIRELFALSVGLLNDPQKSIKEVAEILKFSSEFNFSRFIHRYSGYSPSELRNNRSRSLYVRK